MKKIFSSLIVAVFAVALMAGGAWASQIDIAAGANVVDVDVAGTTTGAVTVATELLGPAARAEDLAVVGGARYLSYEVTVGLANQSSVEITMLNGAIQAVAGNLVYLCTADGTKGAMMKLVDYTANADGNYTWIRFQVDNTIGGDGSTPVSGDIMTMHVGALLNTDADTVFGEDVADIVQPTVVVDQGLAVGAAVTARVTAAHDATAQPIVQALTGTEDVAVVVQGLTSNITPVISTIDVEADRLNFLAPVTTSTAIIAITVTGNDSFAANALADTYDVQLDTGVSNAAAFLANGGSVQFPVGTDMTEVPVGSPMQWTLSSDMVTDDLTAGVNLRINISGADVLLISTFNTTVTFTGFSVDTQGVAVPAGVAPLTVCNNVLSHTWDINAMQAKITYLQINNPSYLAFIKIANEGANDAELTVDAIIWNVTDDPANPENATTQQNVTIKTIPAESITTVSEADLMTPFGLDDTKIYHLELTLTVVAPQNTVHVSAFQKDNVGRTVVPVLYNTNNPADGRVWQ